MIIKRRLGPKGQLIIPKDIRKLLGVKPGEDIFIEITNNEVILRPATKSEDYLSKLYSVPKKLKNKIDIEAIIEKEYSNG